MKTFGIVLYIIGVAGQFAGVVIMIIGHVDFGAGFAFGGIVIGAIGAHLSRNKK